MDWLDAHSGSVQAVATLVLVGLTGYYAWASRALVRETHATLQATARMTLQSRLDHVSELFVRHPELFRSLDEPAPDGTHEDERFHIASMLMGVLEEAYTQHAIEGSMDEEDWRAWVATMDSVLNRRYFRGYWRNVGETYNPSFRRFVDDRLRSAPGEPP